MDDRKLLELAAKAAGLDGLGSWDGMYKWLSDNEGWTFDPLKDDGDALRLAVKLKINIEHMETLSRKPHGVNCWPVGRGDCGHAESDISDYASATRRAIVRAAAAIGDQMP